MNTCSDQDDCWMVVAGAEMIKGRQSMKNSLERWRVQRNGESEVTPKKANPGKCADPDTDRGNGSNWQMRGQWEKPGSASNM